MKKLLCSVMVLMLVLFTCSAMAETTFAPMTLRFGTAASESTMYVQSFLSFGEKVSAATGGAVTVEVYPGSVLGTSLEMLQSTQMGALDIVVVQPAGCADLGVTEMGVLSLPYLFRDYEHYWNTLTGEIGQELLDKVTEADLGLVGFGFYPDGARHYFTTQAGGAIRSCADIQGKKLRIQSYAIDQAMANALGFAATPVAISELYSALQSGVVDGAEQPLGAIYSNKYYEVCSYVTLDGHTYNIPVLLFSSATWARCSDELKAVLHTAWDECLAEAKPEIENYQNDMLKQLSDSGMEVIDVTDRDAWVLAMQPVYDEFGADLVPLIERIDAVE